MRSKRLRFLAPLFAASLVAAAACDSGDDEGTEGGEGEFARAETLYTGGAQWGAYTDFNPNTPGEVSYLRGFIYETLFEFDPLTAEIQPWLAESGEWTTDDVYQVKLRDGITWQDGEQLTADDVVFTFDLRTEDGVGFGGLNDWLDTVAAVDDLTVEFTFSDPRYGEWDNVLYDRQIVPEHTWSQVEEIGSADGLDVVDVGSGPFTYHSHDDTRLRYERHDDWWATEQLGLEMPMRYVVDFANESNEAAVTQITQNELDMSNFFLPNILELIGSSGGDITTYYDQEPYMLSLNTAALVPNNTRAPLDDPEVRRALAYSIDVQDIIENGYGNIVPPANPTGLLPLWEDAGVVKQDVVAEHGFSYDPAEAGAILDAAGYPLDGDFRTMPNGDPIELTLLVQDGWTDWVIAADVIAEAAQAVGLNVAVQPIDPGELDALRREGEYDLLINNRARLTNHPYTNYVYYFQLPIEDPQPHDENPQRYENDRAWELTQELAALSLTDPETAGQLDEVLTELQEIFLTDMPVIPMWYNGMWTQVHHGTWTNWPSEAADTPNYYAASWSGVLQMGTVRAFAELESAG